MLMVVVHHIIKIVMTARYFLLTWDSTLKILAEV